MYVLVSSGETDGPRKIENITDRDRDRRIASFVITDEL